MFSQSSLKGFNQINNCGFNLRNVMNTYKIAFTLKSLYDVEIF